MQRSLENTMKPVNNETVKELINDHIAVVVVRDRRHQIVEVLKPSQAVEKFAEKVVNWYDVKPYDLVCNCLEVRF